MSFRKSFANYIPIAFVIIVYVVLMILSWNAPYFWDNVQLTSKEAHWYFMNGFSKILMPAFGEHPEIVSTGGHPPLMGMMTAILWFLLGKKLWVSHLFIGMVAMILVYQVFLLFKRYFPDNLYRWPAAVVLLEPTLLTQIYIASPDVLLLTAFVVAIRAILDQKRTLLMAILLLLMLISSRGMLMGGSLFFFSVLHSFYVVKKKNSIGFWMSEIVPFIPAAILILVSQSIYIYSHGWPFSHSDSPWAEGLKSHNNLAGVVKNFFAYGLRLVENGRFVIWFLAVYLFVKQWRKKQLKEFFDNIDIAFGALFLIISLLFLYFALTTKVLIASRYYMPMFFILSLLVFKWVNRAWKGYGVKLLTFVAGIFFVTGHFWIYPEKIAIAWDATLAHAPIYQLKAESIDFLRQEGVDFTEVSGGFVFAGYQKYFELSESEIYISTDTDNLYYLYSNISNVSDELIDEFNDVNKWEKLKSFKKGFVFVSVLKNIKNDNNFE